MQTTLLCIVAFATLATTAQAQVRNEEELPAKEMLTRIWTPPKLDALAAKLATQPDMTGIWIFIQPKGACGGPLFDPSHAICPPPRPAGEANFGPQPGTKVTSIPYNAEWQKIYDQHIEEAKQGFARDTFAACVPYGAPRMVGESPAPFDIVQAPEVMFWYGDYNRTERRIFLDGREHLTPDNERYQGATNSGHSVGHWETATLVVDTVNMIPAFFDETGSPHSDQLHMIERLRLIEPNIIENEITLIDPIAFTKPWIVKRYYRRLVGKPGTPPRRYLDFNDRPCVPNVKIDEKGFQVPMLPQELDAEMEKTIAR